jgi:hypothetical protein
MAIDACRYAGSIIAGALLGTSKEELIQPFYSPALEYWELSPLCPQIEEVAAGSFWMKEPPEIEGKGFVVKSLESALWAFTK